MARYPTEAQAVRLTGRRLAEESFQEAERRFAKGVPFERAKCEVLEERIPGFVAEHGEEIADLVIHSLMGVPEKSTHPHARRAHKNRRWQALLQAREAVGAGPPTRFERFLFEWFGRRPRGMG